MKITIRPVNYLDAQHLTAIYNVYLGKATLDTTTREFDFFIDMIDKIEDREIMLVAESGSAIAGYGILKKYSWKAGYYYAGEISIFLENKFTGKGTGEELMYQLIAQAKKWNYCHLVSRIMAKNKGSILFHKKLGYEMVGIQKNIGFAHGEWQDVAIMQLVMTSDK